MLIFWDAKFCCLEVHRLLNSTRTYCLHSQGTALKVIAADVFKECSVATILGCDTALETRFVLHGHTLTAVSHVILWVDNTLLTKTIEG